MNTLLQNLRKEFKYELRDNILAWWMKYMRDTNYGGFFGQRDFYNQLVKGAPKGGVLNCRILWSFSAAERLFKNGQYLAVAEKAYDYLEKNFRDIRYGGIYWEVDYRGKLLNGKKQIYNLAFCIYALSEFYRLTKNDKALEWAIELYRLIEEKSRDRKRGGYFEAFTRDWQPIEDMRLSEKDINASKTMNTHLHILEAYTHLCKIWPDEQLRRDLKNLLNLFHERFLREDYNLHLFYDDNWALQSFTTSFGHDIEYSWLACLAADTILDNGLIEKHREVAVKITEVTLEKGLDFDGGLMYEQYPGRGITNPEKHWWPQAELIVGLLNAWNITGNDSYIHHLQKNWTFIKEHIVDSAHGEWHYALTKDREPIRTNEKAGFWKCPYHNTRALIEGISRLS